MARCCLILVLITASSRAFPQATIIVNTSGTNSAIDSAIAYAVGIWESRLTSAVPIKMNLTMLNMGGGGTLGWSIPNYHSNFAAAPFPDTWYVTSLANSLEGSEVNPGETDIDIFLNSNANFYYGIDGQPSMNEYDFVTILLHEMGHGLGISSSARVDSSVGSFGNISATDFLPMVPSFPYPNLNGQPTIWDRWVQNSSSFALTDTSAFPNYSTSLKNELESDDVFFVGSSSFIANNSNPIKLFAPSTFVFGGSISHLDNSIFPIAGGDGLMIPSIAPQEVDHEPGALVVAMLVDLGWDINSSAIDAKESQAKHLLIYPNPMSESAVIEIINTNCECYTLKLYDVCGRLIKQIENVGSKKNLLTRAGLDSGIYFLELSGPNISRSAKLIIE